MRGVVSHLRIQFPILFSSQTTEMLGDMSVHEGRISKIVSKLNRFLYIVCICLKALIAKIGILVTWYNYFAIIRQR